jgi:hypothetical protein
MRRVFLLREGGNDMGTPELRTNYNHIDLINKEQKRQIEIHKWISSERAGRDLNDEATLEWVEKYASLFRKWAESLPYNCVSCREECDRRMNDMCQDPFNEHRVKYIEVKKLYPA